MDLDKPVVEHGWSPNRQVEFEKAIVADTVLHTFVAGHCVFEHKTSDETSLALKVRSADFYERSDAEMMHYAATHGILAPKVRGIYGTTSSTRRRPELWLAKVCPGRPSINSGPRCLSLRRKRLRINFVGNWS